MTIAGTSVDTFFSVSILHKYDYDDVFDLTGYQDAKFQFYISTIMTMGYRINLFVTNMFQFYISTIMTLPCF